MTEANLGLAWLIRLRWGNIAAQLVTILFARFGLGFPVPVAAAGGLLAVGVFSNLLLQRVQRQTAIHAAVLLDLAILTSILMLTGGASNPFSVLYLLHVALAAVLLGPVWTGAVAMLAALGFGLLFAFTDPHAMHHSGGGMQAHLLGMWLAFTVTGAGISWFVARLANALRQQEAELARLRRAAETQERVVSLATLAAGAAHELGSPLAAIAVSAREIELMAAGSDVAEEARAQRVQIDRCRAIIARLSQRAGAPQAEEAAVIPIGELWAALAAALAPRDAARTVFEGAPDLAVRAPGQGLREAAGSLLQNALQAGPGAVRVSARADPGRVVLEVEDAGAGMPEEVLARAGEPFFTTRRVGEGMGLGLFLARRFAEGFGGSLELTSQPGRGTCARLLLPPART